MRNRQHAVVVIVVRKFQLRKSTWLGVRLVFGFGEDKSEQLHSRNGEDFLKLWVVTSEQTYASFRVVLESALLVSIVLAFRS